MAGSAKKRKKSPSSNHLEATRKRLRRVSEGSTANSLPTSSDWRFRLKIVSSTTEVDNEIFEEAVQGLIQICFPDGVLDELGIDVVAQHMLEEAAPQSNIDRMKSVFETAMIQRIAWMLAEYLDTPDKLDSAVSVFTAASRALHDQQGDSDITSEIEDGTEHGDILLSESDASPSLKSFMKKTRKSKVQAKHKKQKEHHDAAASVKTLETKSDTIASRNNKVSKTWRWNIDSTALIPADISDHFKRASDLFAFHALQVVKRELGPGAEKSVIRKKIESLLLEMSAVEYEKWMDSFRDLREGDATMLDRVMSDHLDNESSITRATPASASLRHNCKKRVARYDQKAPQRQTGPSKIVVGEELGNPVPVVGPCHTNINQEIMTDLESAQVSATGPQDRSDHILATVPTFERLSTANSKEVKPWFLRPKPH